MRAYKLIQLIQHTDGTPDTEVVNLYCEECFRNEWTRKVREAGKHIDEMG